MKPRGARVLPHLRLAVLEHGEKPRARWLSCRIGENIEFSTAKLESYCCVAWQPVVFDMLLLAGAVEFCDRVRKRPALAWSRHFELQLPVHEPERWQAREVSDSLHEALNLLTGDHWAISFVARQNVEPAPAQQRFDIPDGSLSTIPFSDGMDSRIVAALERRKLGSRLIRVRLGSKRADRPRLGGKREPFTSVPYRIRPGNHRFVENSARSRGFKFALVSAIGAYLVGARRVVVPESGQGALGAALLVVGQGYEDYRNHPVFARRIERFLKALLGTHIHYDFPRLWFTKAETLKEFVNHGEQGWADTHSCWQQARQVSVAGRRRQCGICAACMLRRMSVHGAGLEEATDIYVWEKLDAPSFEAGAASGFSKISAGQRAYAIAGTLHLDHLAALAGVVDSSPSVQRAAFQLGEALNLEQKEVAGRLASLLNRHQKEWSNFMAHLGKHSFLNEWATVSDDHAA
jgi:hypothetical protein